MAKFLFNGSIPKGDNPKVEKEVDLPQPIPVYMTYLTVQPGPDGVHFLADPYGRDAHLMERFRPADAGRPRQPPRQLRREAELEFRSGDAPQAASPVLSFLA